ncbi:serine/threonine-protein phosphatase 4 regulatory subunit 2-like [Gastrolobium bilobum]|uniref:serine/threonine-protein phosphatase 4 regulatory subunit 2-like n=1 Tax=Gastrolobium bilobum TaxID=150636 RepID=UPI002AB04EA1|nr:serine/threonine-protein phosphatase 4 regulatory subunit 2-like [Gastrolobium bilobum]
MANLKLAKKRERKKSVGQEHEFYSIDDLSSDDEWIVKNEGSPSNIEDIDDLDIPEFNLDATDEDALMVPGDDGGSELGGESGEDIMQHCFGDEDEDEDDDEGNNEDGDEDDGTEDDYDIPSFHLN